MQIRHLRNSKIITEILILCVAYISMAAGVYIGIAGNDTSKAYYSLIVIIPAIVTYFSRKYIKSYPLFMVINLVFVVIAALLADRSGVCRLCDMRSGNIWTLNKVKESICKQEAI